MRKLQLLFLRVILFVLNKIKNISYIEKQFIIILIQTLKTKKS